MRLPFRCPVVIIYGQVCVNYVYIWITKETAMNVVLYDVRCGIINLVLLLPLVENIFIIPHDSTNWSIQIVPRCNILYT